MLLLQASHLSQEAAAKGGVHCEDTGEPRLLFLLHAMPARTIRSRCDSTKVTSEYESNAHAIASSFAECKAENENVRGIGTPRDGSGKPLHVC